jgi:hypothetical protein
MTELNIDRLTLKLSGISELEGQRLAHLIAQELANSDISHLSTRASPNIQISIPSPANPNVDRLAQQIVADVLQQLDRTLG